MRKTSKLLAAIVFVMLVATSCTKYTIDSENFLVSQFKLGDELIGCTKSEATAKLERYGWRSAEEGETTLYFTKQYKDFESYIAIKVDDVEGYKMRVYQVVIHGGSENPNTSATDTKTNETFLKMFKETYTMAGGDVCRFKEYNIEENVSTSYAEFTKNIKKLAATTWGELYYSAGESEDDAQFYYSKGEGEYSIVFTKYGNY